MKLMELPFVKMSAGVVTSTGATGSVGLDFYTPVDCVMPPPSRFLIPIQIKLQIPLEYYGRLASKLSLAVLHQLHVGAGVIDPDYTGQIMVLMINAAPHVYSIKKGDPITQLILERVSITILREMKKLPPTIRRAQSCGF